MFHGVRGVPRRKMEHPGCKRNNPFNSINRLHENGTPAPTGEVAVNLPKINGYGMRYAPALKSSGICNFYNLFNYPCFSQLNSPNFA